MEKWFIRNNGIDFTKIARDLKISEIISKILINREVYKYEGSLSVYGLGSRYGMLYNEFGFKPADENIESATHGQKVSFEYIVEVNPDYLFVMDRADVTGGESSSGILDNQLIQATDAYKNDNISYLDAHIWYVSSGGITGTMRMVEQVTEAIK